MASRRNTARGPETHVTAPKALSNALRMEYWPSYQVSCTRVSRFSSALRARQCPLTAPSLSSKSIATTMRCSASGCHTESLSVKAKMSPRACNAPRTRAPFFPTFRSRWMTWMSYSRASWSRTAAVPSVEASSTTMTSISENVWPQIERTQSTIMSSSLWTATRHDTRGLPVGAVTLSSLVPAWRSARWYGSRYTVNATTI